MLFARQLDDDEVRDLEVLRRTADHRRSEAWQQESRSDQSGAYGRI
ncbi:MAG: hypothetical protein BWY92_00776 [Firmicutes bacterium ADurb.BinA052]|nr:MAG: hypothetical protein BWY92_00776 [Firmicutes bacterium ADurb.BinA052]